MDDDLEASVFMVFVLSNLEKYCSSYKTSIVVYSDGRGYKNRNESMAYILFHFSIKYQVFLLYNNSLL